MLRQTPHVKFSLVDKCCLKLMNFDKTRNSAQRTFGETSNPNNIKQENRLKLSI